MIEITKPIGKPNRFASSGPGARVPSGHGAVSNAIAPEKPPGRITLDRGL